MALPRQPTSTCVTAAQLLTCTQLYLHSFAENTHILLCLRGVQSQSIFYGKSQFKLQNPETMSESLEDRNLLGPCLDRDMDLELVDLENSNLMTGDSSTMDSSREPMDSSISPMDTFLDLDLILETSNPMPSNSFTPIVCNSRAPMDTRELPPVSMRE